MSTITIIITIIISIKKIMITKTIIIPIKKLIISIKKQKRTT
jgi:hypothetical protein